MTHKKTTFSLFFIVLLALSFIGSLPVVYALDTFDVVVICDEPVRLKGDSLNVYTITNSSSFRQVILSPSNVTVYDQSRTSNFSFVVPDDAEYGVYQILSIVGDVHSETQVTVMDATSWVSASWPYTRNHNNIDFTFFANATLRAQSKYYYAPDDDLTPELDPIEGYWSTLEIDLSMLRNLITTYELDVDAWYNDYAFRVRLSKVAIVVDLTFCFIHTGCKFVINGTLDQARTFTFAVSNPQRLRQFADTIRDNNGLVFDFSDLRKLAYAFSWNSGYGTLSVNVPQSFWLDPVIFEDGFEGGDSSEWTGETVTSGQGETLTVDTDSPVHHGSYSLKAYCDGSDNGETSYVYKTVTDTDIGYLRSYWQVDTLPASGGEVASMMRFYDGSTWLALARLYYSGVSYYWQLYYRYDATYAYVTSACSPSVDDWYVLELYHYRHASAGETYLFVNGSAVCSNTGADTATSFGQIDTLRVGECYGIAGYGHTSTFDCVVFNDEYIGLEDWEEDFETGDSSKWDGETESSGCTAEVNSDNPYEGTYSGYYETDSDGTQARFYADIRDHDEIYVQARVNFTQAPQDSDTLGVSWYNGSWSWQGGTKIGHNGSGFPVVYMQCRNGASGYSGAYSNQFTYENTSYIWEIFYKVHATDGMLTFWQDGVLCANVTGLDTSYRGNARILTVGCHYSNEETQHYFDNIIVSEEYIGVNNTDYSIDLTLTSSFSWSISLVSSYVRVFSWATGQTLTLASQTDYNNAVAVETGQTLTLASQTDYNNDVAWQTPLGYSVASQSDYGIALDNSYYSYFWNLATQTDYINPISWQTPLVYTASVDIITQIVLSLSTSVSYVLGTQWGALLALDNGYYSYYWNLATQTDYLASVSWASPLSYSLVTGFGTSVILALESALSYTLASQTTFITALVLDGPLSWVLGSQSAFNLALPLSQGFSWTIEVLQLGPLTGYIVDLVLGSPLSWSTSLVAGYGVPLSLGSPLGWAVDLVSQFNLPLSLSSGLSYIVVPQSTFYLPISWATGETLEVGLIVGAQNFLDLVWSSAFSWLLDTQDVPLTPLDSMAIAVFALVIAIAGCGIALMLVLRRRNE